MHQTFYIDIDEEITSIIERLRKSKAKEVIIVVPKRALLIQSVINLKLLKKESERLGVEIIIVTQDKLGKLLIEKTGIPVEQKIDDVDGEEIVDMEDDVVDEVEVPEIKKEQNKRNRVEKKRQLENIGSNEYFDSRAGTKKKLVASDVVAETDSVEKLLNKELVTDIAPDIRKKKPSAMKSATDRPMVDMVRNMDIRQRALDDLDIKEQKSITPTRPHVNSIKKSSTVKEAFESETLSSQEEESFVHPELPEEKMENMFLRNKNSERFESEKKRSNDVQISVSGRAWKIFGWFIGLATLIVGLGLAYLFVPKATINIFPKTINRAMDVEVTADTKMMEISIDGRAIPGKLVSVEQELAGNFPATGKKSASNRKAHGTIIIYNEYSSAPQPLVATTRFETTDGKIFRLVNAVMVPGTTSNGSVQPGVIEAEVVADESGESYNIEPATFSIPGFKGSGSEKFTKFYAKSTKAMIGGGGGSESVNAISDSDITAAKNKMAVDLKVAIQEEIKEQGGISAYVLEEAMTISDVTYKLSNSSGEITDNFTVTARGRGQAIVFSLTDLKKVAASLLKKGAGTEVMFDSDAVEVDFGKADIDAVAGKLLVRAHAVVKIRPNLDLENIRKGVLGKSDAELEAYLKTYPEISRAEVKYWPSFISGKIPLYESRVTATLDNN